MKTQIVYNNNHDNLSKLSLKLKYINIGDNKILIFIKLQKLKILMSYILYNLKKIRSTQILLFYIKFLN